MSRQEDFREMSKDLHVQFLSNPWTIYETGCEDGYQYAQTHPNWISVNDELPPKRKDPLVISDKVFIHTTGGHYLSAVYDYQDKEWIDEYNIETLESNEVTHWMKIQPPRIEE